jgi:murein DD-endopeptidase MepM/ murein hydrolase activator NlpD
MGQSLGRDRWLYAGPVLALLHLLVLALLHVRPGLPAVVLWHAAPAVLTIAAILVMAYGVLHSTRARATWTTARAAGYAWLLAVCALPVVAYRTYPSSRDSQPSDVRFQLPLDGPVTVRWGGPTRDVNYHVFAPAERWAYDLLVTREGRSFEGDGTNVTDYYAYGRPVLAPAPGTVRVVSDELEDTPLGDRVGWRNSCGNYVVMEVARGEFLFLCHLEPGSVAVRTGEQVVSGQQIGRVGNSGRTDEPHLHVHLQTTPGANLGEGIPLYFHDYGHEGRFVERGMPAGGDAPQIVDHAGSNLHRGLRPGDAGAGPWSEREESLNRCGRETGACRCCLGPPSDPHRSPPRSTFRRGTAPHQILALLKQDPQIAWRQFGIVDLEGRSAGFSGEGTGAALLDRQGQVEGTGIDSSIQANTADERSGRAQGGMRSAPPRARCRMAAMETADAAGGDRRCSCDKEPNIGPCTAKTSPRRLYLRGAEERSKRPVVQ